MFKGPDRDIEFIYTAPSSAICGVSLDVGGKKEYLIAGAWGRGGQAAEQSPDAVGGCPETSGLPCLVPSEPSCGLPTCPLALSEQCGRGLLGRHTQTRSDGTLEVRWPRG